MQRVRDDGATHRKTVFVVAGRGFFARHLFGGCRRAQAFVGRGAENFTMKFIGARLGLRNDSGARNLVVFGLVVGRDDLVFADRELRERVA